MIRRWRYKGRIPVEPAAVAVSANRPYYTVAVSAQILRALAVEFFHQNSPSSPSSRTSGEKGSGAHLDPPSNTLLSS